MKKNSIVTFTSLLVLYEMACYLSMDAYTPALPSIMKGFNVSYDSVQLTITAWMSGGIISQIIIGPFSERYGRKPILLIGGIVFILSSFACSLSQTIHQLLAARFFQGMVIPSMLIAGYAAVHELLNQDEAIHIIAKMQSVTLLAPCIGPLLGGIILTHYQWPFIFICLTIWGIIAIAGLTFAMPESLKEDNRAKSLNFKNIIHSYAICIKHKKFMIYVLTISGLVGTIVIWVSASPLLIIEHYHYSTLGFGSCQALIFGSFIIGTKLIKALSRENSNYTRVTKFGVNITATGGILCLIMSLLFHENLYYVIMAMMILMMGIGLCFAVFMRLAVDELTVPMGIKMSVITFAQTIIATLSSIIVIICYHNTLLSLAILITVYSLLPITVTSIGKITKINN